MKAISGGKAKNDRIDSKKLAAMLRGGMFPLAYTYPPRLVELLRDSVVLVRLISRTVGYVIRTSGGVGRGCRETPPYPD